jgi:hypothetical protein
MPTHIGTFGVCPTAQPYPQQTPKEPILPTRNKMLKSFWDIISPRIK